MSQKARKESTAPVSLGLGGFSHGSRNKERVYSLLSPPPRRETIWLTRAASAVHRGVWTHTSSLPEPWLAWQAAGRTQTCHTCEDVISRFGRLEFCLSKRRKLGVVWVVGGL